MRCQFCTCICNLRGYHIAVRLRSGALYSHQFVSCKGRRLIIFLILWVIIFFAFLSPSGQYCLDVGHTKTVSLPWAQLSLCALRGGVGQGMAGHLMEDYADGEKQLLCHFTPYSTSPADVNRLHYTLCKAIRLWVLRFFSSEFEVPWKKKSLHTNCCALGDLSWVSWSMLGCISWEGNG